MTGSIVHDDSHHTSHIHLADKESVAKSVAAAHDAFLVWRRWPLAERMRVVSRFVDLVVAEADDVAKELAKLIGRPVRYGKGEIRGFEERARYLIDIAPSSLQDTVLPEKPGFRRFIRREPLGVVFVIAAWNYPYLTAVNTIVPALLAGNAVVLKHAPQTFACGDRLEKAFESIDGVPRGLFQSIRMDHDVAETVIRHPFVLHVQFTGSNRGGMQVSQTASGRCISVGLELGGNDAAYIRHDADLGQAVESIVDGVVFNSGQSCCGVQRIYVHADVYDEVVGRIKDELLRACVLGSPLDESTTIGPVISVAAADAVRAAVADAIERGAQPLVDAKQFAMAQDGTAYVAPQILVGANHTMQIMRDEVFGPVAGLMRVGGDDEAVAQMNDSRYGLTASVWTKDADAALGLCDRIEAGTVFMNRCDYLDPALAWVGIKSSGRGTALSRLGFDALTRPKSFHFKIV